MTRTRRPAQPDPFRVAAATPVEILRAALRSAEAGGDAATIARFRRALDAYEAREAARVAFVASWSSTPAVAS